MRSQDGALKYQRAFEPVNVTEEVHEGLQSAQRYILINCFINGCINWSVVVLLVQAAHTDHQPGSLKDQHLKWAAAPLFLWPSGNININIYMSPLSSSVLVSLAYSLFILSSCGNAQRAIQTLRANLEPRSPFSAALQILVWGWKN